MKIRSRSVGLQAAVSQYVFRAPPPAAQSGVDRPARYADLVKGVWEPGRWSHAITTMICLVVDARDEQHVSENRGKSAGEETLERSVRRNDALGPAFSSSPRSVSPPHTFNYARLGSESGPLHFQLQRYWRARGRTRQRRSSRSSCGSFQGGAIRGLAQT